MSCPLDYSLCDRTVTLYRWRGGTVTRQVIDNAWYDYRTVQRTDALGSRQERAFQLIIPGDAALLPGDRVYDGVGPVITAQQWAGFLPVCVAGLSQVQYVKPYFWQGQICHTEAGRK